jgi:hypothetical protein
MEYVWSHTGLSGYRTCPYQFYRTTIKKDIPKEETEALRIGRDIHKMFEDRLRDGTAFPKNFAHYEPYAKPILQWDGFTKVEVKLGVSANWGPAGFFERGVVAGRGAIDVLNIAGSKARIVDWKGLALTTPIPTPTGWSTMKRVAVGDEVFGRDGRAYRVTGKSEIKHKPCYQVVFTNGPSVVCDDEHLWAMLDGSVRCVTALEKGDRIPLCSAVEYPAMHMLADPYVLGLWLADGAKSKGEVTKPDDGVWQEVQRRGYTLGKMQGVHAGRCRAHNILGLAKQLRLLGILNRKRIPWSYLRASEAQRRDLLAGLMDGDGTANTKRKQVVFEVTDKALAEQVRELVHSLGERVLVSVVTRKGFGRTVTAYMLSWRPRVNPFITPVKAEKAQPFTEGGERFLEVCSVTLVPSVPTACISVSSPDSTYLCGMFVVTHNTGGKVKPDDCKAQFRLNAAMVFANFPQVQSITGAWVHTSLRKIYDEGLTLSHNEAAQVQEHVALQTRDIENSEATGLWPKRPSGLCRGWCPVKDCHHWKFNPKVNR